ncbi:hypothetical protein [Kushneria sp. TE3]|uniref:hypothetical protein n=1 Tax=Kushneria sp. TE3 TaxID=3449832 RepID=UPI003F685FFC
MHTKAQNYPWADELEKTVVNSLVTSFGLDFLLFKDKTGGDVDTVHNVRQGVWATDEEKKRYESQDKYNGKPYHQHKNYVGVGSRDKDLHQAGELRDPYRNATMGADEKRHLDHVISAKEVHEDAGRVLAELNGVALANQNSNLQSTQGTVNESKGQTSVDNYLKKLPGLIESHKEALNKDRERLANLARETPEQQHKARQLEDKIRKNESKIKNLEAVDPNEMLERDKEARKAYDQKINHAYYTSSKFWKQSATASGVAGLKMGTRQMLGLVMAEVWFELREQLPALLENLKKRFDFSAFIDSFNKTLKGIWRRVQARFTDFLMAFKNGVFAGILASVTTTVFNIFATTQVMMVKIIREVWGQLVKAIKLMIFNPEQLSFVDLCQAVASLSSVAAATIVGTLAYSQLLSLCTFPFGGELAAFVSALVTGIVTLGLNYFLLHSSVAQKLWTFVESKMPYAGMVKDFQAINAELDRYLIELSRLEFNLDADELEEFSQELMSCNNEMQRSKVLQIELNRRNIELPYEMGNSASTRKWLGALI